MDLIGSLGFCREGCYQLTNPKKIQMTFTQEMKRKQKKMTKTQNRQDDGVFERERERERAW